MWVVFFFVWCNSVVSQHGVSNVKSSLNLSRIKLKHLVLFCWFQGVSVHLWSAYLAGLPWQACCHRTGESRLIIGHWGCVANTLRESHTSDFSGVLQGTFAGILIGLAQLNCSELKLKRLCCRHGWAATATQNDNDKLFKLVIEFKIKILGGETKIE